MSDDLISISEIARTHQRHRSVLHRIIRRLKIETRRVRTSEARGQIVLHISRADYVLLKSELESGSILDPTNAVDDQWRGFLYIIQLEPELDPGRFKIGFATVTDDRLKSHRTSAPFATLVSQWPCKLLWEKTAIECITSESEKLHTEVFRAPDISEVVERANRFFAIMPRLSD